MTSPSVTVGDGGSAAPSLATNPRFLLLGGGAVLVAVVVYLSRRGSGGSGEGDAGESVAGPDNGAALGSLEQTLRVRTGSIEETLARLRDESSAASAGLTTQIAEGFEGSGLAADNLEELLQTLRGEVGTVSTDVGQLGSQLGTIGGQLGGIGSQIGSGQTAARSDFLALLGQLGMNQWLIREGQLRAAGYSQEAILAKQQEFFDALNNQLGIGQDTDTIAL